jgi:hypothetical protein
MTGREYLGSGLLSHDISGNTFVYKVYTNVYTTLISSVYNSIYMNTTQTQKADNLSVSTTIQKQLQSQGFFRIIKVNHVLASQDSLTLKFPTRRGVNTAVIIYDKMLDLYNLEFWNCRVLEREPFIINSKENVLKGIYWDHLSEIISREVAN